MQNRFTNALVLSLYWNLEMEEYKFYTLYHEKYQVMSPENLNCSLKFNLDAPIESPFFYLEAITTDLLEELSAFQLEETQKNIIKTCIEKIKSVSSKGYEFEAILSRQLRK